MLQICRQVLCDVCVNDPDVYKFLKFFMYLLSLKHLLDGERLFELALSLYIQELYGAIVSDEQLGGTQNANKAKQKAGIRR